MNVYDFDKTIYYYDSTRKFYFFCIKNYKKTLLYLPKQGFFAIFFALKLMKKTAFKEKFYSFFRAVPDMDGAVAEFWSIEEKNIKKWYLENKNESDVIISASPEFLVRPIMEKLGITGVIASVVDKKTGRYTGLNCYGEEKVERFLKIYKKGDVDEFYSDSYSDTPMARLSKKAYIIDGDNISDWEF